MEHCSCSRSCSSDLAHQVFKDPDETVETFPDTETMEGGSIEFKQVGGDTFGLKEPVAVFVSYPGAGGLINNSAKAVVMPSVTHQTSPLSRTSSTRVSSSEVACSRTPLLSSARPSRLRTARTRDPARRPHPRPRKQLQVSFNSRITLVLLWFLR